MYNVPGYIFYNNRFNITFDIRPDTNILYPSLVDYTM